MRVSSYHTPLRLTTTDVYLDTIAGQLAALKGDATAQDTAKKVKKVRKAKPSEEDSDYESGTDDEEGASSGSETDTDTDSEAEDDNPNGKSWW